MARRPSSSHNQPNRRGPVRRPKASGRIQSTRPPRQVPLHRNHAKRGRR